MSLPKVMFVKWVKVHHYGLCGCVAACYIKTMLVCVCCVLCSETAEFHSAQHTAYVTGL